MVLNKKTDEAVRSSSRGYTVQMPPVGRAMGLPPRALIDAGLHIEGDLHTDREVELDGKITGNISCTRLTVGKDATITGNIKAEEVVVRGKVKGTIRATRVILQDSAHVEGEIFHDRIVIEEGARFIGASNAETSEQVAKLEQVAADMHSKAS